MITTLNQATSSRLATDLLLAGAAASHARASGKADAAIYHRTLRGLLRSLAIGVADSEPPEMDLCPIA